MWRELQLAASASADVLIKPKSYHVCMRSVLFVFSTLAIAGEYTTYFGDANPRSIAAIATDAAGNTYVAGNRATAGTPTAVYIIGGDFEFLTGLITAPPPPNDVFVSKIDPSGKNGNVSLYDSLNSI